MTQYSAPERIKNSAPSFRNVVNVTGATLVLTADDSGTLYRLNRAAGIAVTLPAIGADDVGIRYRFFVQTTFTGDLTITAATADLLLGAVAMVDTDTGNATVTLSPDGTDDLILTCGGVTTGGLVHSVFDFEAISIAGWLITGVNRHSGNVATPFS